MRKPASRTGRGAYAGRMAGLRSPGVTLLALIWALDRLQNETARPAEGRTILPYGQPPDPDSVFAEASPCGGLAGLILKPGPMQFNANTLTGLAEQSSHGPCVCSDQFADAGFRHVAGLARAAPGIARLR